MTDRDAAQTPSWHAIAVDETLRRLESDLSKVLNPDEAARRLAQYGPNRLPEGSKRGPSDALPAAVRQYPGLRPARCGLRQTDARSLARRIASSPASSSSMHCLVSFRRARPRRRWTSSATCSLRRRERCAAGNAHLSCRGPRSWRRCAARVGRSRAGGSSAHRSEELRTDEAALTGEFVPADKSTEPVPENSTVGDREDMAFSGTLVVSRAARSASSSEPARRRSSAASIRCSQPSTRWRRRCCARSSSSGTPSRK